MSLMERLLKTLRYNFLTEALDFVGVHQERILQVCHKLSLCFTWLLCSNSSGNESERAEALKSHSCLGEGYSGNNCERRRGCYPICHGPDLPVFPSQCLNAVRTVQSLACLEEADHTVGFILQLSNFTKEWHFHLPQLMRDMQVGIRILLWIIHCLGVQGFGCLKRKWHYVTFLLPLL